MIEWQAKASVAELAYAADLKSAPYQWVAGSSPAARTTCTRLKIPLQSLHLCIRKLTNRLLRFREVQGFRPLGFLFH